MRSPICNSSIFFLPLLVITVADAGKHVLLPSTVLSSRSSPPLLLFESPFSCDEKEGEAVSEPEGDALLVPTVNETDGVAFEKDGDTLLIGITVFSEKVGDIDNLSLVVALWEAVCVVLGGTDAEANEEKLGETIKGVELGTTAENETAADGNAL
ncbi:unnamed protein product [Agarophyton chilense]